MLITDLEHLNLTAETLVEGGFIIPSIVLQGFGAVAQGGTQAVAISTNGNGGTYALTTTETFAAYTPGVGSSAGSRSLASAVAF
jgi:hypothetical protein